MTKTFDQSDNPNPFQRSPMPSPPAGADQVNQFNGRFQVPVRRVSPLTPLYAQPTNQVNTSPEVVKQIVAVANLPTVDQSIPNAPTGISVTNQQIVKSADGTLTVNVALTWGTSTTPPAVAGYQIRYKVSTATTYSYNHVGNVTTATISGLLLNTAYNFSIAAIGQVNQLSAFPTDISVTTNNNAVAPSTVSGLAAVGAFRAVNLSWTAVTDSDLAFYQIEWAPDSSGSPGTFQVIAKANTNQYIDKGDSARGLLAVSTKYWYRVSAFNTTGVQGALSSNVNATTTTVNIDNDVSDGVTFGRPIITRLSSGKPLIDFAETIHLNKTVDNVPDGTTRFAGVQAATTGDGFQILSNPDFAGGSLTGYSVYDNASSGKVTHTAVSDATTPNSSGWNLQIATASGTPVPSPGLGGFFRAINVDSGAFAVNTYHKGATIIWRVRANIPVSYSIQWASNATGTGSTFTWLTSRAGTGAYFEYVGKQVIGTAGTFSSTGFFYLDTGTAPVTWNVAMCSAVCTTHPTGFGVTDVDSNRRAIVDFTSGHLNKNLDNVADGSTFGRPTLTRLSSGKPLIDFSEGIHLNKQLDNIGDGSTFKRLANVNSDNTLHVSTSLNTQGSVLPNQGVLYNIQSLPTLIVMSWTAQTLLRPDGTNLTVNSSAGTNLSVNGDFEAAGTVGAQAPNWSLVGGNALTKDNSAPHSGSFNGKINNAGGATSQNFSTATVALSAGQVYAFEGWIKVGTALPNVPAHVGACIDLVISTGITSFSIITKFGAYEGGSTTTPRMGFAADGSTHAYGFFQCYFTVAANGTVNLNCILQSNGGDAEYDDIKLYPFSGAAYTGLTASTGYWIYNYVESATGNVKFANGSPPSTSPSDTFALQTLGDGRFGLPVKKIVTPVGGTTTPTTDTGGGSGQCPESNELVDVQRYSDTGELIFEGQIKAGEVSHGYESDDGTIKRGDFIKGHSFRKSADVYRAVHKVLQVPCCGWVIINGHRVTPCETVYSNGQWIPAWKVSGATHDSFVGWKVLIQVEADWDDEHNYYVGNLLIHNSIVLGC